MRVMTLGDVTLSTLVGIPALAVFFGVASVATVVAWGMQRRPAIKSDENRGAHGNNGERAGRPAA